MAEAFSHTESKVKSASEKLLWLDIQLPTGASYSNMKQPTWKVLLAAVVLVGSLALSVQAGQVPPLSVAQQARNSDSAEVAPAKQAEGAKSSPFSLSARGAGLLAPPLIFQIDDGTAEDALGWGDGSKNAEALWFNQFDILPCQSPTFTSVSVAWGSPNRPDEINGTPVTIAIWSDPNGDGNPSDAVLLGSVAGTIQNAGTNIFVTYTFSPPVTLPSGSVSFFVGDMTPANTGPLYFYQGIDENSVLHRQSWYALMSDFGPVNLTNPGANDLVGIIEIADFPANWLIRATALPTPTPTPTIPPPSGQTRWYNGDFNGVDGLSNEQDTILGAGQYAHVYDDFNVTDFSGWDLTSVFSNNLTDLTDSCVIGATWEIRQGIAPGNGGTLIASGMTTTPQVTATGRSGFGYTEYSVQVNGISAHLPQADGYYLNVTPIGSLMGRSFISTTSGANALGSPQGNNQNAYFDGNFFGLFFVPTGDPALGQPYDYSMGVNGIVYTATSLTLQSAFSRKTHGTAGGFDVPLPLTGAEGIESRGGAKDSLYLTFNNNLTGAGRVTSSCGRASVALDPDDAKNLIVTVGSRRCNAMNITITVDGITDDQGDTGSATLTYGKLIGDVDGSGVVALADLSAIRAVAPSPVDSGNFRDDLNLDGIVSFEDRLIAQSHRREFLP